MFFRSMLPYHRGLRKNKICGLALYFFHFIMFSIPLFYSGHIVLWEESRFQIAWYSFPDLFVDIMTLIIIFACIFLFIYKFVKTQLMRENTASNYILLIIVFMPFASGFLLVQNWLGGFPIVNDHMMTIHVITGEIMLVAIPFVFLKIHIKDENCTGCTACSVVCPTGTLTFQDAGELRVFYYLHFQCISCGTCIRDCPESAVSLRHSLGIKPFFHSRDHYRIHSVPLCMCASCGSYFSPLPQLEKIAPVINDAHLYMCPRCRAVSSVMPLRSPLFRNIERQRILN